MTRTATLWLVVGVIATIQGPTILAQPYAEFVARGAIDPAARRTAEEAVLYSLASMARLGATLEPRPKVYFAATTSDCVDVHIELGGTRDYGNRRCRLYSGMTWPGIFALNMENVRARNRDPIEAMWGLMPHELFHLYQWQTGMFTIGTPWAFQEAPADLHKLKVLDERRIISFSAYAKATVLPRARTGRRNQPQFSIQANVPPTDQTLGDWYALETALGLYLHENGGWPKIMVLHVSGATTFAARFVEVYGRPLAEFEQEFFTWLARQ